ncbi:O-antigen ligase family protein [bacterium]|nr:MAG: O-antigen ligase family protein [bacterium]
MFKKLLQKNNLILAIAIAWQFISVGLISTNVWPDSVALINLALLSALFVILPKLDAVGLFLLSLPFMIVLPIGELPMWRPLVAWLFLVVCAKYLLQNLGGIKELTLKSLKMFAPWDKWLFGLLIIGVLSLLAARFKIHGAKQIIFLFNIYLLYVTCLIAAAGKEFLSSLLYYVKFSLLITVILGFVQYGASLLATPYYFWQYWATLVSSSYYGDSLGEVLSYSNSWFSANGGGQSLRMFGILQDTHAFSVIVIFALALWIARFAGRSLKSLPWYFWVGLVGLCFAVIASGTRGAWLAMLAPVAVGLFLLARHRARSLLLLPFVSYGIVVVLFVLSPLISSGLNLIRTINTDDNFLDRATSIYDLNESSNVGRLEIWKSSINYAFTHPLGTGYGNFISSITHSNSSNFEEVAGEKNLRYNLPQKFITAHSLYLHLLVELGVAGLILFGIVWLSFFKNIWLKLKSYQFEFNAHTALLLNIGLAMVWLLAYGFFDVTILNERVLLYLMALAAIVNLSLKKGQEN